MDDHKSKEILVTYDDVSSILDEGDFSKFISHRETEVFEAKSKKPYNLPQKKAILELTKDVASLANNRGGYIVCGLTTGKKQNSPHDYIVSLDLIKEEDFYSETQITGLVSSNIHPRLDVKVKWFPSKEDATVGLGVIMVTPQDDTKKYFIIKILEVDGETTKEFFGIPVRTDCNSHLIR